MPPRKHSKKRDAIYECVRSTKTHPSAEWVYSRLKPEIPDLSLGTVYRNLNLFQQEGRLISVGWNASTPAPPRTRISSARTAARSSMLTAPTRRST